MINKKRMETALKRYNSIMYDVGCEYNTIGEIYSENTENWNLRDMVAECDYLLMCYYEEGNVRCDDRFLGKEEYKMWIHETGILRRFIKAYEPYIMDLKCYVGHCSNYD